MSRLLSPKMVGSRVVWVDEDLIDRIHFGDPTKGWEGDTQLAVYLEAETPEGPVWALYRVEDDGVERHVVRTEPGVPFDLRVIDWLVAHDMRKKPAGFDLNAEVRKANDKVDADKQQIQDDWIAEDIAPRLKSALRKDGF